MTARITVLISGRGSNMQAIHHACSNGIINAQITHVISNNADAAGLDHAKKHGIHTTVIKHQDFNKRSDFDSVLAKAVEHDKPDLVLLAGFMRRLTGTFTRQFSDRLINIHPSLLPRHPGLNTHEKALQAGDKWHGCSVHFVNESLDGGPLIARGIVPVLVSDKEATLAARVLATEHRVFTSVVRLFLHGGLTCQDSHVKINDIALQNPLLYYY